MGPLAEGERWRCDCGDNLPWMAALPTGYAAMTLTSPPYEAQRTYGVGFKLRGQSWVDFMIPRVVEMCRVTNGLVCVNMSAPVNDFRYSPVVEWLVADLVRHHGVVCGPAPYVYHRSGIPGSGGPHYHRRDWEPVYCFARPECLPPAWSDNTAMGHPPKWAPGGEMSNRMSNGKRVNAHGVRRDGVRIGARRGDDCHKAETERPAHASEGVVTVRGKFVRTKKSPGRENDKETYDPPVLANPGNRVQEHYTADDVVAIFGEPADVIKCIVGGNNMGDGAVHGSEAGFSERLAEFFVRSYAPADSVVLDPFAGSATTVAVAYRTGRRGLGCDLRESQCLIARKRLGNVTQELFA